LPHTVANTPGLDDDRQPLGLAGATARPGNLRASHPDGG
jgi:hypothetical protein